MNMLAPRLDFTPLTDHQEKLLLNGNVNIDVIGHRLCNMQLTPLAPSQKHKTLSDCKK